MNNDSLDLVTGGCGFIGRHLVAQLSARGARIRVLDIAEPDCLPPTVDFLQGSVLDRTVLRTAMREVRHVYHLAGTAQLWAPHKAEFLLLNALGTKMVMRAAAEQGIKRVIHCSTESILLPKSPVTSGSINEETCPAYDDMPGPYTRSKHLAERAALSAAENGLDVVVVNPTVPIGAEDDNMTPPTAMLAMLLAGGSPAFIDCVLNLVDVHDVAHGIVLAAERGRRGERYILGGENVPFRRLLDWMERLSERPMPKRRLPARIALTAAAIAETMADLVTGRQPVATREGVRLALRSVPFDSRKAERELGYAPQPVYAALAEAVRWLSAMPASSRPHRRAVVGRMITRFNSPV
jgi:dihydroflavonol-4-reductase